MNLKITLKITENRYVENKEQENIFFLRLYQWDRPILLFQIFLVVMQRNFETKRLDLDI